MTDSRDEEMDTLRDHAERLYSESKEMLTELYMDDRIREVEEASALDELSDSARYERLARQDAEVIRKFEEARNDIATADELDRRYREAKDELELTGERLISMPSYEDLKRNAPRTVAKTAVKRVFSLPASVAVEAEYGVTNTLRRARSVREDGDDLVADLMEAAALDRIPFKDAQTSDDRLEELYEQRRRELRGGDASLLETVADAFDL